jgi:hypothetical protein
MTLKKWINEIKPVENGPGSEAVIEQDHPRHIANQVDAIIQLSLFEIEQNLKGNQFHSTDEIRNIEEEIDQIAKAIYSGNSSDFNALRKACACWVKAASVKPAHPVLFVEGEK